MNSREIILQKLLNAKSQETNSVAHGIADSDIYCDYPDKNARLNLFEKRFASLKGELHIVDNFQSAAKILEGIVSNLDNKKCMTFTSELIENVLSNISNHSITFDIIEQIKYDSHELAGYSIGLTTADFLIARTGSIVLNSLNDGGRRLSVLPPIHIVIAKTNQIVASLDDIFKSNLINENWSYATIITGPSRTSDIEKQLVLGAHGPKRLIVILIENI